MDDTTAKDQHVQLLGRALSYTGPRFTAQQATNILGDHDCEGCGDVCDCCQPHECVQCSRCATRLERFLRERSQRLR